jgi:tRNA-specific 2-thiouridylase
VNVLVAMSGGVDSAVAAALLLEQGHSVTGVTMKLWGGDSDTGCCAISDTHDARRVADHLGIEHHVFNFGDDFDRYVVAPYVADHAAGRTPNPCIECNRHIKFDRLMRRAAALEFEAVATGHHARIVPTGTGSLRVARGTDRAKDQSYVLHMLDQDTLARLRFPLGDITKAEARRLAAAMDLRVAAKPDSQDVCFITRAEGRRAFLEQRLEPTPGSIVDTSGRHLGRIEAVELVTVGQRKGLGIGGLSEPLYTVAVDVPGATVTVGGPDALNVAAQPLTDLRWVDRAPHSSVQVQASAHGTTRTGQVTDTAVVWTEPSRSVAPGQSLVFYVADEVVGGATAA